jgi:hypothetical protein
MPVPRWFYLVVATCAVILTAAVTYSVVVRAAIGRWVPVAYVNRQPVVMDTRDGTVCDRWGPRVRCRRLTGGDTTLAREPRGSAAAPEPVHPDSG